jgi:hypothetical protein
MRPYRAAKILLPQATHPTATAAPAAVGTEASVPLKAMESIPWCAIWALQPHGLFASLTELGRWSTSLNRSLPPRKIQNAEARVALRFHHQRDTIRTSCAAPRR